MNKKTTIICASLLLLLGACVLAYPAVSSLVNRLSGSYAVQALQQELDSRDAMELQQERAMAEEYNTRLLSGDPMDAEEYLSILDFGDGIMGSIRIPKIDVDMPIYHGVSEKALSHGAGHMPESAFPIGGEGNHAVLTGHTGLPSAKLFTDLTKLEIGDLFYVHILGEVLCYQVDQIKTVLPSEGQDLTPVAGEDLCTLVTCTPYGINSHRLLVRGRRTETPPAEQASQPDLEREPFPIGMLLLTAALLAVAAVTFHKILRGKRQLNK